MFQLLGTALPVLYEVLAADFDGHCHFVEEGGDKALGEDLFEGRMHFSAHLKVLV